MKKPTMIEFKKIDVIGTRQRSDYSKIVELKESIIATKGIIQSLLVFKRADGRYTLVAGGRRRIALQELFNENKLKEIYPDEKVPCIIVQEDVTQAELELYELEENVQRQDLTQFEESQARARIHEVLASLHKGKWSYRDTADYTGLSHTSIADADRIVKAARVLPEIEKAKTKTQAMNIMKKTTQMLERKAKIDSMEKGTRKVDAEKKKLIDMFFVDDAFEWLPNLQSGSADLIEIDPPYAIDLKDVKKGEKDTDERDEYNEWTPIKYEESLPILINEADRILKSDGWLVFWFGLSPWYQKTLLAIRKKFRCSGLPAIWVKSYGQTNNPELVMASQYETFFYARKGNAKLQRPGRSNIFIHKAVSPIKKPHITTKPISLSMEIYASLTGIDSRIVIPFCGSGWGMLAANNEHMKAIGCDMSGDMKEKFSVKVMDEKLGEWK